LAICVKIIYINDYTQKSAFSKQIGEKMRFGLAKTEITPRFPVKIACTGNFTDNYTAIHDDVYVRCLLMDDGVRKALFMSFELLFHSRELNNAVAEYAKEKYGIDTEGVIVTYTHAHTAPAVKGYNPGYHNDEYEEFLVIKAKECLDKAMSSLFEGYLTYGSYETELNICRRRIVDGVCKYGPNPDGERDTQMFVMCVRDCDDGIRGILVNYACHPVFYPHMTEISAEFPGRVCQLLESEYYGCISLYTQSAAGDVRPLPTARINEDGTAEWAGEFGFSDIDKFAKTMYEGINSFISSGRLKKAETAIECDRFEMIARLERAPKEEFEAVYERLKTRAPSPTFENCRLIVNGLYEAMPDQLTIYCNTLKLCDDLYIAAMGGEPCNNVKKIVKSAFEGKSVCFMGYTDSCAYIVDDVILDEGGYEPESYREYGLAGRFKKGLNKLYFDGFSASYKRVNKR